MSITLLVNVSRAEEAPEFKKNCYPCTANGYYYCKDDPNLVNLNADKCYTSGRDMESECRDFEFISNRILCDEVEDQKISQSSACD